jgi:hypothetical protein
MWRRAVTMMVAVGLLCVLSTMAEACPTCKEALNGQAKYGNLKYGNLPQAYMWSIIFMMSMPFLLLGSFGAYMFMLVRRSRQSPQPTATGVAARVERETVDV